MRCVSVSLENREKDKRLLEMEMLRSRKWTEGPKSSVVLMLAWMELRWLWKSLRAASPWVQMPKMSSW